jgi:hypothetical protein
MSGLHPKNLSDYLPVLSDQGIPNVVATPGPGVGLQFFRHTMDAAPDTFVFADHGLSDMADDEYEVVPWNQTDVADQGVISAKTTKQFVITGPDAADEVTLIIVGRLANQLG